MRHPIRFRRPSKWRLRGVPAEKLCRQGSPGDFASLNPRRYSTAPPAARLNTPIDYATTPLLHHTSKNALSSPTLPNSVQSGTTKRLNLFQAINSALSTALSADPRVVIFGEDVAFGGVFRCTSDLALNHGSDRVFNTPLTEQGIAGFAIGAAAQGLKPVAEIQFADYVYPAYDQLVNEAAKWRYREGATGGSIGGLVVRMPCGGVGHGALYHSQSPEVLFSHIPGLRVVMPRGPWQAKGLLLSAIMESNDPVIFMEPKMLYRAAVEQVPSEYYTIPLSEAEVVREGKDVTVVSYGAPMYTCLKAIEALENDAKGKTVELIDLQTIYPWDRECVVKSVQKTGRAVVVHESMVNSGTGAEVSAIVQEKCFLQLEAPVQRCCGWSTHSGLIYERFNVPDVASMFSDAARNHLSNISNEFVGVYDAIRATLEY